MLGVFYALVTNDLAAHIGMKIGVPFAIGWAIGRLLGTWLSG